MLALTTAWVCAGVLLHAIAPLSAPGVLVLALIAPVAWYVAAAWRWPLFAPSPAVATLALGGAYLLANASWSLNGAGAYAVVAIYLGIVAILYLVLGPLAHLPPRVLRALAMGLVAGMIAAGVIYCIEVVSGQWLRRQATSLLPWFHISDRGMQLEHGWVTFMGAHLLNRSMAVLALLMWPALLALQGLGLDRQRRRNLLLGLAAVPAAVLAAQHGTSKMALLVSAAVYGLALLSAVAARRLVIAAWLIASLLVVPLASLAYTQQAYLWGWVPHSAKHRLVIWGYTSEQFAKAPVLGAGINAARVLSETTRPEDAPRAPGSDIPATTGWHTHNVYLQLWFETGAVGGLLLCAIGLLVLSALARAPSEAQPLLYAAFTAAAVTGASSFSLWAPWFMASFAIAAVNGALGLALAKSGREGY